LVLLSSVLFALWPTVAWPWKHMSNSWFLWSEILYTLSAGALWAAAVHANLGDVDSIPLGFVAVSLVAQTLGLLLLGIGAQVAWGHYWAWDPVESWRLAAWLATAALAIVLGQLGWRRRRARLGTSAVALLVLLVLWGSFPLVHWLGLLSAYLPN
jgi:ABC-type transport system involved in cytochrome c biogenesis permease subunit